MREKSVGTSLKWKLMIMYITLVFIVMIISGTFMIIMIKNNFDTAARRDLTDYASMVYEEIYPTLTQSGLGLGDELWQNLKDTFRITRGIQWHLINAKTGETFFSNATNDRRLYQRYHNDLIIEALRGGSAFSSGRKSEDINGTMTTWMEFARPILDSDNQVRYVLYVRQNGGDTYESLSQTTNTILLSILLALLLTGILGFLFSSSITEPIKTLTRRSKELAQGRLDKEIPVLSRDEVGQLTESFNFMAKELNRNMADIQREKNKMEIVLYNMTDGVLAYDREGHIIHVNHVCRELLGVDPATQPESLNLDEIKEWLNITDEKKDFTPSTIKLGEQYLSASVNPYLSPDGDVGGTVVVLQDITKHIMLDNMRKEFVANVSHEIRTPLTTIKSYTETLMDGAIDERELAMDFLSTIDGETDRMAVLVQDLLELSRLDNNQMTFNFERVDLVTLVSQNINKHIITAQKQGKTIEFNTTAEHITVFVDPQRINQVLNNIISNSLKYSDPGAVVNISIESTKYSSRVHVSDNGLGIPKEDLGRIFERFYRVDKARSRELGGTGLGLSIAKEIMEAHGGSISAQSEYGEGTTMTLRFPTESDISGENDEP